MGRQATAAKNASSRVTPSRTIIIISFVSASTRTQLTFEARTLVGRYAKVGAMKRRAQPKTALLETRMAM